jgi:hypothetical protein
MGYYLIVLGLELSHDATMSGTLDDDVYDTSRTVTLRIPMSLPYQYDNPEFMRVEGKFVHNGESYRLIKQKYEGDVLTVVCIKDHQDKKIQNALSDVAGTFADPSNSTDVPSGKLISYFIKEYLCSRCVVTSDTSGWVLDLVRSVTSSALEEAHFRLVAQPPEA